MKHAKILSELRHNYPCGDPPKLGLGLRPAILVIDFIEGFTNPESPLGGSWARELESTSTLIESARTAGVPVIYTVVEFYPADLETNLLYRKAPRIGILLKGSRWTRVDHRIAPQPEDMIISKQHGSAFFGTSLASQLQVMNVDTLLLSGCVTSGCVRATAVDAAQTGFRPAVVRETVADRSVLANEANLMDIEQRYGDVLTLEQACSYLQELPGR